MIYTKHPLKRATQIATSCAVFLMGCASRVSAAVYDGGGVGAGVNATNGLAGVPRANPREVITNILQNVLAFMALAAVTVIIIAGIYLIVGMGSDDSKEKAKKIIQYTLIGLLIILFSEIIVGVITVYLANRI